MRGDDELLSVGDLPFMDVGDKLECIEDVGVGLLGSLVGEPSAKRMEVPVIGVQVGQLLRHRRRVQLEWRRAEGPVQMAAQPA